MNNKIKKIFKGLLTVYHKVLYWLIRVFRPMRKTRRILLYCSSNTMESHILDYYKCVCENKRIKWYLFYPECNMQKVSEGFKRIILSPTIKRIKSNLKLFLFTFDLIVNSDIFFLSACQYQQCPRVYINHGLHIISYDGGESLYAYGEFAKTETGKPAFTKMFEPNRTIVEKVVQNDPAFRKIMVHTGYKFFNKIDQELDQYHFYRQKLGINANETFVTVFGSWNKDSLFHVLGSDFLDAAKSLQNSGFRFMLSIHPREYIRYDNTLEPLGEEIESKRSEGFLVRSPNEDWLPYLIASDIVICDYSSMYELAIMAKKKLIFSSFPYDRVWKYSVAARIFNDIPILTNEQDLRSLLINTKNAPLNPIILKYRNEVMPPNAMKYEEIVRRETNNLLYLK